MSNATLVAASDTPSAAAETHIAKILGTINVEADLLVAYSNSKTTPSNATTALDRPRSVTNAESLATTRVIALNRFLSGLLAATLSPFPTDLELGDGATHLIAANHLTESRVNRRWLTDKLMMRAREKIEL